MTNLSRDPDIVKSLTNVPGWDRPLGDVMREAHRTLVTHLERALRKAGYDDVGAAHASVLATVDRHGARLATLVERGGRTKQATGELAGHLVARGYLELHPDPTDGRAKLYLPTASGYELLASCELIVEAYEKWLNGVLGESGVAQLRHALTEIVDHGA
jgi:DNA-binding MarR family transcriptional regulator